MSKVEYFRKEEILFNEKIKELIFSKLGFYDEIFIKRFYTINKISISLNLDANNKIINSDLKDNLKFLFLPRFVDDLIPKYAKNSFEGYGSWVASKRFDLTNNFFDNFINQFEDYIKGKDLNDIIQYFDEEKSKIIFKYFSILVKDKKYLFYFSNELSELIERFKPDILMDVILLNDNKLLQKNIFDFQKKLNIKRDEYFVLSENNKIQLKKLIPDLNL